MLNRKRGKSFLVADMDKLIAWDKSGGQEDSTNLKMLKTLAEASRYAIAHELTQRQRECFTLRYERGMTLREISSTLGICPSAVGRHIAAARGRIQSHAAYCVIAYGKSPGLYSAKDGDERKNKCDG